MFFSQGKGVGIPNVEVTPPRVGVKGVQHNPRHRYRGEEKDHEGGEPDVDDDEDEEDILGAHQDDEDDEDFNESLSSKPKRHYLALKPSKKARKDDPAPPSTKSLRDIATAQIPSLRDRRLGEALSSPARHATPRSHDGSEKIFLDFIAAQSSSTHATLPATASSKPASASKPTSSPSFLQQLSPPTQMVTQAPFPPAQFVSGLFPSLSMQLPDHPGSLAALPFGGTMPYLPQVMQQPLQASQMYMFPGFPQQQQPQQPMSPNAAAAQMYASFGWAPHPLALLQAQQQQQPAGQPLSFPLLQQQQQQQHQSQHHPLPSFPNPPGTSW